MAMKGLLNSLVNPLTPLHFELSPSEPFFADVCRIQQVLLNLVVNASDAIGRTGGNIVIGTGTCSAEPTPGSSKAVYTYLEVADCGEGMSEEVQKRLFERGFTTRAMGRGLVLSVVKSIVAGYGGHITIRSRIGEGTAIRVLFPTVRS